MKIFKLFKEWHNSYAYQELGKDTLLMMRKVEYDEENEALKTFLMNFGQTHKFIAYKKTGRFCKDPKRNIEFIEEMEENTGNFKKTISRYQNAKNRYNKLLANQ